MYTVNIINCYQLLYCKMSNSFEQYNMDKVNTSTKKSDKKILIWHMDKPTKATHIKNVKYLSLVFLMF